MKNAHASTLNEEARALICFVKEELTGARNKCKDRVIFTNKLSSLFVPMNEVPILHRVMMYLGLKIPRVALVVRFVVLILQHNTSFLSSSSFVIHPDP